ncbi:hypothetical protein AALD22_03810 [Lachnospiraceae bacterium 56-18]
MYGLAVCGEQRPEGGMLRHPFLCTRSGTLRHSRQGEEKIFRARLP